MKHSPKDNGVLISILISVGLLAIIYVCVLLVRSDSLAWNTSAIIAFIVAGLLTTFLGRFTLFAGIRHIGSSRVVAIKNTAPLFTIAFALAFLGETISLIAGVGIVLILLGLYLTAFEQWKQSGASLDAKKARLGLIFAALAAFCFGTGQAVSKLGIQNMADPIFDSLLGTVAGLIGFSVLLTIQKKFKSTLAYQFQHFNLHYFWAGVCTTLAFLFFFISITYTKVSYASSIVATEPLLTLMFAYFFLKRQEVIDRKVIMSSILVFTGIVIISLTSL